MRLGAHRIARQVWAATAVSLALLGAACSSGGGPRQAESTSLGTPDRAPYTGYPDSMAVLGHSAVTGEGTQPGASEVKANSWATGTNPQVRSIYLRILAEHPDIKGHAVNLGEGSADVTSLALQAQSLIAEEPQPQLVLIATLDADIVCPASQEDFDTYGENLGEVLQELSAKMPASRFFITTQISTPRQDAQIYSREERASLGGTGPCAFIDPDGDVVPKELKRLEAAVAGFKEQLSAACSQTDRCSTDQSGKGWKMQAGYSDDLDHLNLEGQARWAEHVWSLLEEAQLVPRQ
jgi:hypothetical protein